MKPRPSGGAFECVMKIVVTGAKGTIGQAVARYAAAQGVQVLAVDNVGRGDGEGGYLAADLTDLGQCCEVLHGADAVINLAAVSAALLYPGAQTLMTNVGIAYNVCMAAALVGVPRVVWASSVQVFHSYPTVRRAQYRYFPVDEEHPNDPQNEYALSKVLGEQIAEYFARQHRLTAVSLRLPEVVPPEMWADLPRPIEPWEHSPLPHYVHLEDCARACFLAATVSLPPATHHVVLITAEDTSADIPTRELIQRYYPEAEVRAALPDFASLLSGKRAEVLLGFRAAHRCHA